MKKTKLTEFIRTVPNYPIKGINFYDLNSLFAGPMYRQAMKELKIKSECRFKDRGPSHIVGIESRGFVIGSVLAYAMKLPFIMVRKAGAKYPGELLEESYTLEYGKATGFDNYKAINISKELGDWTVGGQIGSEESTIGITWNF